ncbi:hypothetical protein KZZ10_08040 [Alcaligenaceae bacterium LF4-65]|jgi:hypothetical protein|uniref:Uncharacterized protein n=1 Tax=Zwartia hollandica TaxID=324606 RepID=A0A953NC87_9BURK|nr:hypothetical protein [Zwartia hollandica]MBZ1350596.1 hypothetical protein [Zwartia hollandica]
MDSFNIIWCTLWSDYFMTQHQYDDENRRFNVPVAVAADFLFFLSEMLGQQKTGYYSDDEQKFVSVELSDEDVDKLTDWILDFNFSTRKPLGLTMPDLYLDEEKILVSTVNVYCHRIAEFLAYMIENQSKGRDEVAEWATKNFLLIYAKAYADALKAKDSN